MSAYDETRRHGLPPRPGTYKYAQEDGRTAEVNWNWVRVVAACWAPSLAEGDSWIS